MTTLNLNKTLVCTFATVALTSVGVGYVFSAVDKEFARQYDKNLEIFNSASMDEKAALFAENKAYLICPGMETPTRPEEITNLVNTGRCLLGLGRRPPQSARWAPPL